MHYFRISQLSMLSTKSTSSTGLHGLSGQHGPLHDGELTPELYALTLSANFC